MKNAERVSKLKSCATVEELVEDMFNPAMDSISTSYPEKRRLTAEWIEMYAGGLVLRGKTPRDVAEKIYPPSSDDDTMLFQELRAALVEWIENYKNQ